MMRSLRLILLIFCCIDSAWSGSTGDSLMNRYDVLHYDLAISPNLAKQTFTGSVIITARAIEPLDRFAVSAFESTITIDSVILNGQHSRFIQYTDYAIIEPITPINTSDTLHVSIHYHGSSTFHGEFDDGGIYFSRRNRASTSSEPSFARRWWPCKDIPSDKATATIAITVPEELVVASNGVLDTIEHSNGTATYYWRTEYPIATYLISFAIAPYSHSSESYTSHDGTVIPIEYYVFPEDSAKAKIDFQNTTTILKYFESIFGPYPFSDEKFGFAEVDGDLTMENQTLCSIQQSMFTGDRQYELTLSHETAHQWFGNMLTPADWHHTWLNEGFATYAEALYLEHRKGYDAYLKYIKSMMDMPIGTYAGSIYGKNETDFWDSFAPRVYYKGALVLHMLRTMVGDSTFFRMIAEYAANPKFRYQNVRSEDFIASCEQTSGLELEWFFHQWIYADVDSADRPVLTVDWCDSVRQGAHQVTIEIAQKSSNKIIYRLPFPIIIETDTGDYQFEIIDSLATQTFQFTIPEKPKEVIIDPDQHIFKILEPAIKD